MFIEILIGGIQAGSLYSLVALGLIIIFKATNILNFAYGEMVMMGGYFSLIFYGFLRLPLAAAFILVMLSGGILGLFMERIVCRPLQRASPITIVIATVAMMGILRSVARLVWGPSYYALPIFDISPIQIFSISLSGNTLYIILISLICMIIFYLFFVFTKLGKGMRATSENAIAASLMGVRIPQVFFLTWTLAGILAALTGLMMTPLMGVFPDMGNICVKGFAAGVLGGFGSVPGGILGGLFLGIAESLAGSYISTAFKDVIAFLLLVAVLIFCPTGIFGERGQKT
jgi:branched-chain amino acid transport system permease protein